MTIAIPGKWLWDSWYVRDGASWHGFFLQADRSLGNPDLRHLNVTQGHATSTNLVDWTHLGTTFTPQRNGPAWDDSTTWTGSVVRGDDGLWTASDRNVKPRVPKQGARLPQMWPGDTRYTISLHTQGKYHG